MMGRIYTLSELVKKYNTKLIIHENGSIEHTEYEEIIEPEMFAHLGREITICDNMYFDWILEPWMYTKNYSTSGYSANNLTIQAVNRGFDKVDILIKGGLYGANEIQNVPLDIQMARSFAKALLGICDEA